MLLKGLTREHLQLLNRTEQYSWQSLPLTWVERRVCILHCSCWTWMQHHCRVTWGSEWREQRGSNTTIYHRGDLGFLSQRNESAAQGADQGPVQHPPLEPNGEILSGDQQLGAASCSPCRRAAAPAVNLRNFQTIVEVEIKATLHSTSPHLPPWLPSAPPTHHLRPSTTK